MLSHFVAPPVGTRSSSPNILKIVTVSFPFEYLTIFSLAHIRNTAVARRNEDIHCKWWLALPAPFPVWTKQMPDNITLGERFDGGDADMTDWCGVAERDEAGAVDYSGHTKGRRWWRASEEMRVVSLRLYRYLQLTFSWFDQREAFMQMNVQWNA